MGIVFALVTSLLLRFQDGCPAATDFPAEPVRTATVRIPTGAALDTAWVQVRSALQAWSGAALSTVASGRRQAPQASLALIPVEPEAALRLQSATTASSNQRRTCFFATTSGRADYRVAFLFQLQRGPRAGTASVQVRWLGQAKGRAERTWRAESDWSAGAAELLMIQLRASH